MWGCVDVQTRAEAAASGRSKGPAASSVMTDQALRRAVMHLRQAVPQDLDFGSKHSGYMDALNEVFALPHGENNAGENNNGGLMTMVSKYLPAQLGDRYAQAVREIRVALGARFAGAPRRCLQSWNESGLYMHCA